MTTAQGNSWVGVKWEICRESSFAKQKFIVVFFSVQQTVKHSKVNNCCDKLCASCTSLHLLDMNGLRWVILACGISSQTSWFTRHSWTMVSGGGSVTSSGNQWGSLQMLNRVQDGEYAGHGRVWTAFDLGKAFVRQIEKGKALCRNPVEPCSTPLPIQNGTSIQSSGAQCKNAWNDYAWSLWISGRHAVLVFLQQFLWIISPIDIPGECAIPLTLWFLEVAHSADGSRWFQSLVGDVSTTELLFVAHRSLWCHLQSSCWFAAYPLPFLCRRWWGPSKLFFVGMCFCNIKLACDYRRSDAWFN